MQFPWASIKRVEGDVSVSKNGKVKIGRQFIIVFRNEQKFVLLPKSLELS